jgi:carboxypeptidase PM20D1
MRILIVMCLLAPLSALAQPDVSIRTSHEALARQMLVDVIAMDTSVIGKETPKMAAYLARHLREAGFGGDSILNIDLGEDGTSLVVRYSGKNPQLQSIGFMAHMDVVPAFRKDWELDPFVLTEEGDYFIGRGTADNKAGVVSLVVTFMKLKKAGYVPERDLILVLTSDEETGMVSIKHIANNMADELNMEYAVNADALSGVLAPDGSVFGYYVQGAEKGYRSYRLTVTNPGGHSSAPRPDNAIYQLAHALIKIQNFRFPTMINEISEGMLRSVASRSDPATAEAIYQLLENPRSLAAADKVVSNSLISTTIRTTCVATMLEAGHAENALPQSASAVINCRIMPAMSPGDVEHLLKTVINDDEIQIQTMAEDNIGPASPMREDVMSAIAEALAEYPGVELIPFMASYGTDGKEFRIVGIPVYGSSGMFMDPREAFAHGLNEKIPVEAFYKSLKYWERLMKILASNP